MMRRTVAALLGVALLAGAGCGDDDEGASEEFCEIAEELAGDEQPTEEELDRYVEAAPEEIRDEAELVADAITEEGDAAFDDDDVLDAIEEIEDVEAEECDLGRDDDDGDDPTVDDTTDDTTDDTGDDTTDDTGDDTTEDDMTTSSLEDDTATTTTVASP